MTIALALATTSLVNPSAVAAQDFRDYPATELAAGRPVLPSFDARDSWARSFRTRIAEGVGQGANYAGSYSVIEIGCGSSCRFAFVVDVRNGEVFRFPYGGEEQYALELQYLLDSRMMKARWQDGDRCITQMLVWDGASFTLVNEEIGKPDGFYCALLSNE